MLKRSLALGLVLCVASVANAGYTIDVSVPAGPYLGGETVQATVGLTGAAEPDVFARGVTFDFAASDSALGLANWSWAPAYENGQQICSIVPSLCGTGHFEDTDLPKVNATFLGTGLDAFNQIAIPGNGSIVLGSVDVTLPTVAGTYTLDAVNNAAADQNNGARLDHDFANPTTVHGTFLGGTADITVAAIPEPATLALLGLGGIAALRRRKNAVTK